MDNAPPVSLGVSCDGFDTRLSLEIKGKEVNPCHGLQSNCSAEAGGNMLPPSVREVEQLGFMIGCLQRLKM